jgi:transcriptional regulator with XRE-family HTH domain
MVQGRKPDLKQRARIQRLRDAGFTLAEIGRRLGITRQAVQCTLRRIDGPPVRSVPCAVCGQPIVSAGALPSDTGKALCLPCLAKQPDAPFSQRLKAFRLAAGLTKSELVARSGLGPAIWKYEDEGTSPKPPVARRLARALGVSLEELRLQGRPVAAPSPPKRDGKARQRK